MAILFERRFSMPNSQTFMMAPVRDLLTRWLRGRTVIVDPFARNSKWASHTNDLDPHTDASSHLLAQDYVHQLSVEADAVIFDPPYSPRQISECYKGVGIKVATAETQNAALYRKVKDGLDIILKNDGIAICCGWNSMGFGIERGYQLLEILLVPHGAAHNDTIVTVEKKIGRHPTLNFSAPETT